MTRLAILCLALCSCGEPRLLNPGADLSVTAVSDHDMSVAAQDKSQLHWVVSGLYASGTPGHILLLDGGEGRGTFFHELCHAADANHWTIQQSIDHATPPNPSPEMKRKLAVAQELADMGPDYWQNLKDRFGADAVGHASILARLR